jgi:hypothetical protein
MSMKALNKIGEAITIQRDCIGVQIDRIYTIDT